LRRLSLLGDTLGDSYKTYGICAACSISFLYLIAPSYLQSKSEKSLKVFLHNTFKDSLDWEMLYKIRIIKINPYTQVLTNCFSLEYLSSLKAKS